MKEQRKRKCAGVDTTYCVACGVCMRTCPVGAISIPKGIYAQVNPKQCIGCTKCTKVCPASTIHMEEVEQ
ncbi:MAG: 4Fe-4S binding protein, partial [Niameybacter sp.]